jgi:hypothetical protein
MTLRTYRCPTHPVLAFAAATACATSYATVGAAQTVTVSLAASAWEATDSVRSESYLARPSLYINKGVALARDVVLENGTIEYDVAATPATNFLGVAFRAASPRFSEVLLLRVRQSGTPEALQYAPAFNNTAAAWQVYHGPESNAVVTIPRERWMHVRIELEGEAARIFFDTATTPTLTVPRLAGAGGHRFGVWTGAFGRGAYFSNIHYTPSSRPVAAAAPTRPEPGVITDWDLSNTIEPAAFTPASLPDLATLTWKHVVAEPGGFVLVNRYREQPNSSLPVDPRTRAVMTDSVMTGKVAGSKVVYARATIDSPRDEIRRMEFCYSDGAVIYVNGQRTSFSMNPQGFRDDLGIMARVGDAVYVRLKQGRNEIIFAVIELGGGWAFGAKLDEK